MASAGVLGVVLAILLLREPGPGASARPVEEPAPRRFAPPARAADPDLPWPERDPFRYAEEHRQGTASAAPPIKAAPLPPPAPAPTANPLRLIGIVRKGGTVKAAVSMWGETVMMAEGEESRGYKVLSIDDEGGVRLRGPDGSELMLPHHLSESSFGGRSGAKHPPSPSSGWSWNRSPSAAARTTSAPDSMATKLIHAYRT